MRSVVRVVFLQKSSREGKRRDGTTATYYNVDVMVPGVGPGQISVDHEVFQALEGVTMGTECEVEVTAKIWNGRLEFRPVSVRPARKAA